MLHVDGCLMVSYGHFREAIKADEKEFLSLLLSNCNLVFVLWLLMQTILAHVRKVI